MCLCMRVWVIRREIFHLYVPQHYSLPTSSPHRRLILPSSNFIVFSEILVIFIIISFLYRFIHSFVHSFSDLSCLCLYACDFAAGLASGFPHQGTRSRRSRQGRHSFVLRGTSVASLRRVSACRNSSACLGYCNTAFFAT